MEREWRKVENKKENYVEGKEEEWRKESRVKRRTWKKRRKNLKGAEERKGMERLEAKKENWRNISKEGERKEMMEEK